jgi:hypothetical protein
MSDDWRDELETWKASKDEYLREHPHSPIPRDQREGFDGLDYYPPDPDYRFVLDLDEHDDHEEITVETTTDGAQRYHRWGTFRFELDGEEYGVDGFKRVGEEDADRLWVPVRDATSGDTTYGAGRYLDLDADDRTDDGRWVVDFNYLYSPFCAYNDAYECPLTPMSNWIDAPIEAGEKYEA